MKIYSMRAVWSGDDNVYKNMLAGEDNPWGEEVFVAMEHGRPVEMKWAIDSEGKKVADFIMFPISGLASRTSTLERLSSYMPGRPISPIQIDGRSDVYGFLKPRNFRMDDKDVHHVFLMRSIKPRLLVTETFKDEWERMGLTGAVFEYVTEMDDSCFIEATR